MKNCHENRRQIYKIPNKELKLLIYKELLHIEKKEKSHSRNMGKSNQ